MSRPRFWVGEIDRSYRLRNSRQSAASTLLRVPSGKSFTTVTYSASLRPRNLAGKWRQPGQRLYLESTSIARAENAGRTAIRPPRRNTGIRNIAGFVANQQPKVIGIPRFVPRHGSEKPVKAYVPSTQAPEPRLQVLPNIALERTPRNSRIVLSPVMRQASRRSWRIGQTRPARLRSFTWPTGTPSRPTP